MDDKSVFTYNEQRWKESLNEYNCMIAKLTNIKNFAGYRIAVIYEKDNDNYGKKLEGFIDSLNFSIKNDLHNFNTYVNLAYFSIRLSKLKEGEKKTRR